MKTIAIASITILLLFSCELWAPTTYNFYVEYNAVWNEDFSKTLILRSEWKSANKNSLYYYDNKSHDWVNKVYIAGSRLENPVFLMQWNDEHGDNSMAWLQDAPIYWHSEKNNIFYSDESYGIIRNLNTGAVKKLAIPANIISQIFQKNGEIFHENGRVSVIETLASPDGKWVTVLHSSTVQIDTFTLVDIMAIGLFDSQGAYIGYVALDEWNFKENVILFKNPYNDIEIPGSYKNMPTNRPNYVFWPEDSSAFYVINWNNDENNYKKALKVNIDIHNGQASMVEEYLESIYPMPQFAVYGGSVNKNKEMLVYKSKGRNSFTIATYKFQL